MHHPLRHQARFPGERTQSENEIRLNFWQVLEGKLRKNPFSGGQSEGGARFLARFRYQRFATPILGGKTIRKGEHL